MNPFVDALCVLNAMACVFQTIFKGDEHWLPICDGGGEKSGPEAACKYLPRLHLRTKISQRLFFP